MIVPHNEMDIIDHVFILSDVECPGLTGNQIVDDTTIDQLRGCTIITSGFITIGRSDGFE